MKFDKCGFMEYLNSTFHGFDNPLFRETVENVIDYAIKNKSKRKSQMLLFLREILPCDIKIGEIEMYINNTAEERKEN